jgi:hypothetical protein
MEAIILDQSFVKKVAPVIRRVWNAIACDVICDDNESAIEVCIDNMDFITGSSEAFNLIRAQVESDDWRVVIDFLAERIHLV